MFRNGRFVNAPPTNTFGCSVAALIAPRAIARREKQVAPVLDRALADFRPLDGRRRNAVLHVDGGDPAGRLGAARGPVGGMIEIDQRTLAGQELQALAPLLDVVASDRERPVSVAAVEAAQLRDLHLADRMPPRCVQQNCAQVGHQFSPPTGAMSHRTAASSSRSSSATRRRSA